MEKCKNSSDRICKKQFNYKKSLQKMNGGMKSVEKALNKRIYK
jgi:hypothetical protein